MDAVDSSNHYEVTIAAETPSLLSVILDTNPRAWAALQDRLPLSSALASILVFINAHLAFSNTNQVAVIAAHVDRALWLYPSPPTTTKNGPADDAAAAAAKDAAGDVDMADAPPPETPPSSANKYPQFAQIEAAVVASLDRLVNETTEADLADTTTQLSGALTLALCHISKASLSLGAASSAAGAAAGPPPDAANALPPLKARILVISVSDSEPAQYIPTMNAVFAAAHAQVAIDTLALAGNPTFLQQASFNTDGTFLAASNPQGLLTYLMFGLIADTEARKSLITPTQDIVDFRAACFCHGNVVDTGFVCSVCLSIFCELPDNAECLTCGTKLALGKYGSKPAVVPRRRKKKKRIVNGNGREETGSAVGTPRP
ncbi:Transcription factor Tfb4 [Drechmeria coniospora]|uniref:General transcription and DNA repair factor IIH subunit TFB4 n=1 Tax=Drechmeria coniospora TaxID=98403 RepID=A0A151GAU0_DRECN|nr:Transcription factor Tfb4 [Drechmeria coniospora]KYK54197.1 Transcription factor Tfb4 [Drechmeria coniospora]ODA77500.1 hypothetical protein RJ55_07129 [Drechmeria coniospora]